MRSATLEELVEVLWVEPEKIDSTTFRFSIVDGSHISLTIVVDYAAESVSLNMSQAGRVLLHAEIEMVSELGCKADLVWVLFGDQPKPNKVELQVRPHIEVGFVALRSS